MATVYDERVPAKYQGPASVMAFRAQLRSRKPLPFILEPCALRSDTPWGVRAEAFGAEDTSADAANGPGTHQTAVDQIGPPLPPQPPAPPQPLRRQAVRTTTPGRQPSTWRCGGGPSPSPHRNRAGQFLGGQPGAARRSSRTPP